MAPIIQRLKTLFGQGPKSDYAQAIDLYNQGRYALAGEKFEQYIRRAGPRSLDLQLARFYAGRAHRNVGLLALHRGEFRLAADELKLACNASPEQRDLWLYFGIALFNDQKYVEAIEVLHRLVEGGYDRLRLQILLTRAELAAGRFDAAEQRLEGMIGGHPTYPDLHHLLARARAGRSDFDAAAAALDAALEHRATYVGARVDRAKVAVITGQAKAAVELLTEALRLAPDDPTMWWDMTMAAAMAGDGSRVNQALDRLFDLDPKHERGRALRAAMTGGELARAADPFISSLAGIATNKYDEDQAEELGAAIRKRAEEELTTPRPYQPNFSELASLLQEEADEGLSRTLMDIYKQLIIENPGYADLHYHLGRVHERLGELRPAIERYKSAIGINPDYGQAKDSYQRLLARIGADKVEDD